MRSPKTDILVTAGRNYYVADVSLYKVHRLMKRGGLVPVRPYRSSDGRIYLNASQVSEVREVESRQRPSRAPAS